MLNLINVKTGSGRVFSGSGIWENAKYLDGKRNLTVTGKRGFTKIWARGARFFLPVCWKFGKSYVLAANVEQVSVLLAMKKSVVGNDYIIETVK